MKNSTIPAIIRIVGVYHLMYRSIIRIIGIFVCSASIISSCTLPSVVSLPAFVTVISSAPVRLFVPAKTCIPGTLSTGSDSPVIVASFTELKPFRTSPSAGILSPGRTRTQLPGARALTSISRSVPSGATRLALVGVNFISDSIEALAPSAVRVSMSSLRSIKKATMPAVT